jgi:O-antigen/teichoic acid export membrane protein
MNVGLRAATNVGSSWLNLAVQMAVGLVLSPFILHKVGDTAFGTWLLILSLTAYYGLLDFGIRASISRYVARFAATSDVEGLRRFVNTCLAACTALGLVVLLLTGLGFHNLGHLFKIPADFLPTARILFVVIGADAALAFPLSVFGCVLEGYQDFWWLNLTQIAASLLRGILILAALGFGGGLLMIAFVTLSINLARHLATVILVLRSTPMRFGIRYLNRAMLNQLVSYSAVALTIFIAESLRFQSDNIVIGAFLSSAAVTYFAIGAKLVEYPASIVVSLSQIFTPMASHVDSTGDRAALRAIFVAGSRACALVIFPICAFLMIFGKSIIELWMGTRYEASYSILLVLILPKTLLLAQSSSVKILLGLGRQRTLALVFLADGLANLLLSIVLLRHLGIIGVAIGTAVPLTCTSVLFLPRHLCRMLGIRVRDFLRQAYLLPIGLTIPTAGVLLFVRQQLRPSSFAELLLQAAPAGLLYGLGLICFGFTKSGGGARFHWDFAEWRLDLTKLLKVDEPVE